MRPLYADFLDRAADLLGSDAAREAAAGYARAGELWAAVADRATSGPMAPYRRLVERRLELVLDGGLSATAGLSALAEEQRAFLATVDISDGDRAAQLDGVAELAAEVLVVERDACAALGEAAGVGR
jgi:hypothetical protein